MTNDGGRERARGDAIFCRQRAHRHWDLKIGQWSFDPDDSRILAGIIRDGGRT
jgi:hypothetical protein